MFASRSGQGGLVLTTIPASFGPPLFASKTAYSPCQLSSAPSFAEHDRIALVDRKESVRSARAQVAVLRAAHRDEGESRNKDAPFHYQKRVTCAVGGMIARVGLGFSRSRPQPFLFAAACQPGEGAVETAALPGRAVGAQARPVRSGSGGAAGASAGVPARRHSAQETVAAPRRRPAATGTAARRGSTGSGRHGGRDGERRRAVEARRSNAAPAAGGSGGSAGDDPARRNRGRGLVCTTPPTTGASYSV
jgi:hypothetical protein